MLVSAGLLALSAAAAAEPRCIEPNPKAGQSLAVVVDAAPLVHTGQILPSGPLVAPTPPADQVRQAFTQLEDALKSAGSSAARVVKLNVYVNHPSVSALVEKELAARFSGKHQPAVALVQTPLTNPSTVVALDAVATADAPATPGVFKVKPAGGATASPAAVLPAGPQVYISGQAEKGDGTVADATQKTMASLFKTLEFLKLTPADVVHVKAFLTPFSDAKTALKEMAQAFGETAAPPMSVVQWESSLPIEIEMVVAARPADGAPRIEFLTPPGMTASPVFCRVTRVHAPQTIYVSGLFGSAAEPSSAGEIREIFAALQRAVEAGGGDLRHLAKATYYVADDDVSKLLNELRPEFYDPQRPPAASKAKVVGSGRAGRTITLDMIAVPRE